MHLLVFLNTFWIIWRAIFILFTDLFWSGWNLIIYSNLIGVQTQLSSSCQSKYDQEAQIKTLTFQKIFLYRSNKNQQILPTNVLDGRSTRGPRLLDWLMFRLLSWGKYIIIYQYRVLNITNLQINTNLYIKLSDVHYLNGHK